MNCPNGHGIKILGHENSISFFISIERGKTLVWFPSSSDELTFWPDPCSLPLSHLLNTGGKKGIKMVSFSRIRLIVKSGIGTIGILSSIIDSFCLPNVGEGNYMRNRILSSLKVKSFSSSFNFRGGKAISIIAAPRPRLSLSLSLSSASGHSHSSSLQLPIIVLGSSHISIPQFHLSSEKASQA
jgi:hypothetical protein